MDPVALVKERLQREINTVRLLLEKSRTRTDRSVRLNLPDVAAFESGVEFGYDYMLEVLSELLTDLEQVSEDG